MWISKILKYSVLVFVFALSISDGYAQSVPVGSQALEEYYRNAQLLGKTDSTISFTIRPLSSFGLLTKDSFYPDTAEKGFDELNIGQSSWNSKDGKFNARLLPMAMQLQFNSHHPYGWNDGAMIPAKGLQSLITAGIYAEYGPLTIQFNPELVLAANDGFDTFDKDHYEVVFARYYDFYNNIDAPARFGPEGYSKAYWGQSSIRLNYKALSLGLSTENLWWGPGRRNSLLMSNTAPGFKHVTFNTNKPVKTPIGSFEGQLITGRLEGSGFGPLEPNSLYFGSSLYLSKPNDWRYLSGLALSWQPKWVPGLFLGLTKSKQLYHNDLLKLGDYLPFFSMLKKNKTDESLSQSDERLSYFMRWLWKEEQAEFYFEFGKNNYSGDLRDVALEPQRSRAYIAGLRKMLPFNKSRNENLLISIEVTQMQETDLNKVLNAESWYINKVVRHGYTNRGEVLGAGIGPGGNLQSLELSWSKNLNRLGIQVERYVHNNDFYYYAFQDSQDFRRHWTDLSFAANGEWGYKNFIFNAQLKAISSINYQWYLLQKPGESYMVNGKDVFNVQLQAGLTYRF